MVLQEAGYSPYVEHRIRVPSLGHGCLWDSFLWIRSSLTELGVTLTSTPILWCDNQSATALASNPKFHSRTKHIELDVHFLQEKVATQSFQVRYVPSSDNVADIMTKALSYHPFRSLCTKLNLITLGWAWGGMLDDKLIWCCVSWWVLADLVLCVCWWVLMNWCMLMNSWAGFMNKQNMCWCVELLWQAS